jgi:peptidoglycan-associated lipoprotein
MEMHIRTPIILFAATAALALGGCATESYVDEQVAAVSGKVAELASHTDSRFAEMGGRVDAADRNAQAALQAANGATQQASSAQKLAEGKLVYAVLSQSDEVNFDTNKWKLSDEAQATLTTFAERLKTDNKSVFIEIEGHGDPRGSVYNNRILAEKRALEVRRFLTSQGIPLAHMETVSWGEERPGTAGTTSDDHAANRRVVLRVLG